MPERFTESARQGDHALVRVVGPPGGPARDTPCVVEVSSDGGETWKMLPTGGVNIDSSRGDIPVVAAKIVAIPGVVDIQFSRPS